MGTWKGRAGAARSAPRGSARPSCLPAPEPRPVSPAGANFRRTPSAKAGMSASPGKSLPRFSGEGIAFCQIIPERAAAGRTVSAPAKPAAWTLTGHTGKMAVPSSSSSLQRRKFVCRPRPLCAIPRRRDRTAAQRVQIRPGAQAAHLRPSRVVSDEMLSVAAGCRPRGMGRPGFGGATGKLPDSQVNRPPKPSGRRVPFVTRKHREASSPPHESGPGGPVLPVAEKRPGTSGRPRPRARADIGSARNLPGARPRHVGAGCV